MKTLRIRITQEDGGEETAEVMNFREDFWTGGAPQEVWNKCHAISMLLYGFFTGRKREAVENHCAFASDDPDSTIMTHNWDYELPVYRDAIVFICKDCGIKFMVDNQTMYRLGLKRT